MQTNDFLLEIGTEEMPAKLLLKLSQALSSSVQQELQKAELSFSHVETFVTPRRLALLIQQLPAQQADRMVERKGPAVNAAFDAEGKPTKALEGFARSCGVDIQQLEKQQTPQGEWFIYRSQQKGKTVNEILPEIFNKALTQLPIPKPMRWSDLSCEFIRPVHWIVMLYGEQIVAGKIFELTAGRKTFGHRFHHPQAIEIKSAQTYAHQLRDSACVIADFSDRRHFILEEINLAAKKLNAQAIITEELLDEVTGLVEWPVILVGSFAEEFLQVPAEALMASMVDHQKSFPLKDANGNLLAKFITVSNIQSLQPEMVIHGNERVMRARLSDAQFFYQTDCKQTLLSYVEQLKNVVFQTKLGTLYDKVNRIAELAKFLNATCQLNISSDELEKSALLCKADLMTSMVGEFPELQGIMGYYYAKNDAESAGVAQAIREHYQPKFSGDELPASVLGCVLAIADRIDTIVGIFSVQQIPTGDKDPFGLRRAAQGVLRIIIEKQLPVDLDELIKTSLQKCYGLKVDAELLQQIKTFISERLPAFYAEKNIAADRLEAVLASCADSLMPLLVHHRVLAIDEFLREQVEAAEKLIAANKRIRNILKNVDISFSNVAEFKNAIAENLFEQDAERQLFSYIEKIISKNNNLFDQKNIFSVEDYRKFLLTLSELREPIDTFFDNVMVMHEDEKIRNNRLYLVALIRQLFLAVADFSLLQS